MNIRANPENTSMTAQRRIPVAGPKITEGDIAMVADAARTNWYSNYNEYIAKFEDIVAKYCGVKHAIAVPHATSALHLAYATIGLTEGDEIIVPEVTWIASVAPVYQTGAQAVLVDITPDTWCIDPAAVERAITPKTKAILGVDLYGSMCDWPALEAIAKKHGLRLIEDAAESLGSKMNDRPAGNFGDMSVLSFHGSKTVTCGEGGMLLTNDTELFKRALFLRDHGRTSIAGKYQVFFNTEIAFKYKMSSVQAALGYSQMQRIDELIDQKRNTFFWYRDRLEGRNGLRINVEPSNVYNCFWMPTVIIDKSFGLNRDQLMEEMDKRGVDTRPVFTPLSNMPAFAELEPAQRFAKTNEVSREVATYGINLPSSALTTEEDADFVSRVLLDVLNLK
jgi:perosamine synthetase